MSQPLVIEARRLEARYGSRTVVSVDRLLLASGQTLALLGPNGAGKSSLLRLLALLERPRRGELSLFGEAVTGQERQGLRLRRRMATVFQAPLLTSGSVFDNVARGLRFRGLEPTVVWDRVDQWLRRFGIAHLAGQEARTLSGGEAQRVSLARAFAVEPEILFLDEPFASLDQHGREALALELEEVLRRSRIATVLVTHDRSEALMLADEVALLMDGAVRQIGSVRDVLAHPADADVARFVGVENLLPARVVQRQGEVAEVSMAGRTFRIPRAQELEGDITLCVRAEDVHLTAEGGAVEDGRVSLDARVQRIVPFGVPYRVYLDAGFPLVALAAERTLRRLDLREGSALVASFDPSRVHAVPRRATLPSPPVEG
ncbi:MAG: ABC transporter ATP-binding protein [Gemmatimonadota bacterium]|nr:ABC transporter ATP-binding protein [Gemmatimonadota bacterium]MDH5283424.1 ABC transporter ATP-binding protein [Gemmatimonadota bacterium]